ncbi:MAG: GAF domain-containing protein [Chloroflexi bacterium]|nr:GAF domain-containing protein [Chloroflexota bacterium]
MERSEAAQPRADPARLDESVPLADSRSWPDEVRRIVEIERRQRIVAEELHTIAQHITGSRSLEEALAAILQAAEKIFGAVSASILLPESPEGVPHRRFTTRHTGIPHWDDHAAIRPEGLTRTVLQTGRTVVVEDIRADPHLRQTYRDDRQSFAAVPISHGGRAIGVLFVDWRERRSLGSPDIRLLETLAAYGAIAIENARLHAREREARREAEEAHRRLRQFIGMIAHELRGPLGVVATSFELLRTSRRRTGEVERRVLPATENAIRRMRRLVDDLIGATRIDAGRFHVRPFPMDLVAAAGEVIALFQGTSAAHRILLDAPPRCEGEWDPERIAQLLSNLISNAIKYSPDGGEVRVSIGHTPDTGDVLVRVSDQGIGIPPEKLGLLFQPFSRLDPDGSVEGLGLGLYIARAIVEAHGGRIWAESTPGAGSVFSFTLPAVPAPPA